MIVIDVVGGVQQLADAWVAADDDVAEAQRGLIMAEAAVMEATSRREEAHKRLTERVGRNVTTRVFRVGMDVVIVEYERGVRRVRLEGMPE